MKEHKIREILYKLGKTDLRKSGKWLNCACPLAKWTHPRGTDSKPSFGIAIEDNAISSFNCYSCKHTGQVSDLIRKIEYFSGESLGTMAFDSDMSELQNEMPSFVEFREEKSNNLIILDKSIYYDIYPEVKNCEEAVTYLSSRNISVDTATKLNLFYDPKEYRILFPVCDSDNNLYGFSGRSILRPDDYPYRNYPKIRDYAGLPKQKLLLGEERIKKDLPILVVEGLFAYASLIDKGVEDICSVVALLGSNLSCDKAMKLVLAGRPTYLLLDNDEAGDVGLFGLYNPKTRKYDGNGAISKLEKELIIFVPEYPEGKIDPDELTYNEVKNMLTYSKPFENIT